MSNGARPAVCPPPCGWVPGGPCCGRWKPFFGTVPLIVTAFSVRLPEAAS